MVSKIFLYNSVKRESVLDSDYGCFQVNLRWLFYFVSESMLYPISGNESVRQGRSILALYWVMFHLNVLLDGLYRQV